VLISRENARGGGGSPAAGAAAHSPHSGAPCRCGGLIRLVQTLRTLGLSRCPGGSDTCSAAAPCDDADRCCRQAVVDRCRDTSSTGTHFYQGAPGPSDTDMSGAAAGGRVQYRGRMSAETEPSQRSSIRQRLMGAPARGEKSFRQATSWGACRSDFMKDTWVLKVSFGYFDVIQSPQFRDLGRDFPQSSSGVGPPPSGEGGVDWFRCLFRGGLLQHSGSWGPSRGRTRYPPSGGFTYRFGLGRARRCWDLPTIAHAGPAASFSKRYPALSLIIRPVGKNARRIDTCRRRSSLGRGLREGRDMADPAVIAAARGRELGRCGRAGGCWATTTLNRAKGIQERSETHAWGRRGGAQPRGGIWRCPRLVIPRTKIFWGGTRGISHGGSSTCRHRMPSAIRNMQGRGIYYCDRGLTRRPVSAHGRRGAVPPPSRHRKYTRSFLKGASARRGAP